MRGVAVAGVTLMHVVLLFKERKQHEKIKPSYTGDYKNHWHIASIGEKAEMEDNVHSSLKTFKVFPSLHHTHEK